MTEPRRPGRRQTHREYLAYQAEYRRKKRKKKSPMNRVQSWPPHAPDGETAMINRLLWLWK